MKSHYTRAGLAVLLVFLASCSGKGKEENVDASGATQAETAGGTADASASTKPVAEPMGVTEERQKQMPRDRFDFLAVVNDSRDAEKIVSWVRENTRHVPYEGLLRGPLGVLMDRSGNSLDRSLLLARFLEIAGHEARVVGAGFTPKSPVSGGAAAASVPGQSEHARTQLERRKQADATATMIVDRIGQLNLATPHADRTHYWVQYKDGDRWVDADPTLATTGQTHQGMSGQPVAVNAESLKHSVTMSLIVERWEAGKLAESLLAVVPFEPVALPMAAATVSFVPVDVSRRTATLKSFASGAELSETLLDENAWAVVLGDETGHGRIGRMFDDAGIVSDTPSFSAAGRVGAAGGQAFGAMTGDLSGYDVAEDEVETAPTVLTALIAEYEIGSPGKPSRQLRRFIFDSLGPEARNASGKPLPRPKWTDQQKIERGADLVALNDTLVAYAGLPFETYVYRYAQRVIDAKDAILAVAGGAKDEATRRRMAYALGFRTLEYYAAERDATLDPGLAIVEPQIYRRILRYMPTANAKVLDVGIFADLAWNRLAPAAGSTSAKAVIAQGILDTLQEREIVMADGPSQPGDNTAALFAEAATQGIEIIAVRDSGDQRLAGFPGPARARMLGDIAGGQIVVTPAQPVKVAGRDRLGWWRVDPGSGQTVGAMDTGLLQDETEYSITEEAMEAQRTGATTETRAYNWAVRVRNRRASRGMETSESMFQSLMNRCADSITPHGVTPPI